MQHLFVTACRYYNKGLCCFMNIQHLVEIYIPFTCVSDFVKDIPKYANHNHLNRFDEISNKASIFLQKAVMSAINRKVKNIAI